MLSTYQMSSKIEELVDRRSMDFQKLLSLSC